MIEQNLLTGEKKTFQSLIRVRELMIDESVIVVQNPNEVQVLDRQYNLISQGKAGSPFPQNVLFSELKLIVSVPLADPLEVFSFSAPKIQKQNFLPSKVIFADCLILFREIQFGFLQPRMLAMVKKFDTIWFAWIWIQRKARLRTTFLKKI
ncbi:hypothetical protein LEP1GSC067_2359 [Leptospira interrogans serovar Lora str. TE 1992]|uniref:Uncharacterized protein n=1 Tax=Leptospira interrogans serovar Lora str. TE 1992 TaxID=1193028 RepID=M3DGU1_LEPIR|nr:hypothetical protein LEP1GSC067_2359 [Leptospira interrogans serovar Lora str. TE 1992]